VLRVEDGRGGWLVRVVPNLYPALDHQEVVVHSPRHVRTFAELHDEEVAAVAEAWRARGEAARAAGFGYQHALVNEGRAAGSSLPHSHSQLAWLHEAPPERTREKSAALPELLGRDDLAVAEAAGTRAVVHACGRVPYELLIGGDGELEVTVALLLLRECIRRLRAAEGPVPWNAWLHEDHLEVVPRLSVLAGLELGAGIYVNTVAPEDAAETLRAV
jgi:UDPglucose--hexose-1-phosphate uridylyltransferase